jgi:hypothetical protein
MKKSLMLFVGMCLAAVTTVSAQSNNDQYLIAKAKVAAHDCLHDVAPGVEVDASVETYSICFVSGDLQKVVFYTTVKCHQEPCQKIMSRLVATVYFGCDNEVTSVECTN